MRNITRLYILYSLFFVLFSFRAMGAAESTVRVIGLELFVAGEPVSTQASASKIKALKKLLKERHLSLGGQNPDETYRAYRARLTLTRDAMGALSYVMFEIRRHPRSVSTERHRLLLLHWTLMRDALIESIGFTPIDDASIDLYRFYLNVLWTRVEEQPFEDRDLFLGEQLSPGGRELLRRALSLPTPPNSFRELIFSYFLQAAPQRDFLANEVVSAAVDLPLGEAGHRVDWGSVISFLELAVARGVLSSANIQAIFDRLLTRLEQDRRLKVLMHPGLVRFFYWLSQNTVASLPRPVRAQNDERVRVLREVVSAGEQFVSQLRMDIGTITFLPTVLVAIVMSYAVVPFTDGCDR